MKKLIFTLLCAGLFSPLRADVENQLASIEAYLSSLVTYNSSIANDVWTIIKQKADYPDAAGFVTAPIWGPFEDWLSSQFQDYFDPIRVDVSSITTYSRETALDVYSIYQIIGNLPELLNQANTDANTHLETYLENAVSSPLNAIYTQLQNGINVHGTVSADFNFDYSRFNDVFSYYAAATGPSRFNLAYHKRYVWSSHIYDPKKPIPEVVTESQHGGESYDFLGFIEQYCNGSLQNMESLQAGLIQVLGALRGDDAKTEEITDDFESVESNSESQMTELSKTIDFSKYNFEVSDELFRYEVFAIGDGSLQMPEFVSIGPFDLRGFGPEISSFGFSIDCREWRPFFELIRSCFTIIIYLLICTLALSICFLLWKVGAPCVRVLQNIFNF